MAIYRGILKPVIGFELPIICLKIKITNLHKNAILFIYLSDEIQIWEIVDVTKELLIWILADK